MGVRIQIAGMEGEGAGRGPGAPRFEDAFSVLEAGLRSVDPAIAVQTAVVREGALLRVGEREYDLGRYERVFAVGAGKAAAAMADGLCAALGDRLERGLVIVKHGHGSASPDPRIAVREAGHPWPDAAGLAATRELLGLLEGARERDLLFVLISGGGSALLELPVEGVTLEDLRALTDALLRAGAEIEQINAVRKHLSRVKAGQLARAAAPATVACLVLSDIVGAPLDAIASCPTAPDPTTFAQAWSVLERHGIAQSAPPSIVDHLKAGLAGRVPETPKAGDPVFQSVQNLIVAGIEQAATATAAAARARGYEPLLLTSYLTGEAREVAKVLASVVREVRAHGRPVAAPAAIIAGGETTVTLRGKGKGGRNQELALAAALALEGLDDVLFVSLATDGSDGPTDAAGGAVTGATAGRLRQRGRDPIGALDGNDAYPALKAAGALLETGPTRTNVCDLILALVW